MVHKCIHPRGLEFIVKDPVDEVTDSQFLGTQSQTQGLSIYCIIIRYFYSSLL